MKVLTVIGARPQFIKASPVSNKMMEAGIEEVLVNTGQHYDSNLSDIFFEQLKIPISKYALKVGSGSHGYQTGEMLKRIDPIIENENPDILLVYGDTNSTLAGAISAAKLNIPVCHIEAGLRSFNRKMPEEMNRVITDNISSLLFCPSEISKHNLKEEGISDGVYVVGDVMYDIFKKLKSRFNDNKENDDYCLLTMHRVENTNKKTFLNRLKQIENIDMKIIFPIHPRTKKLISEHSIRLPKNIIIIEPIGWIEMMNLIHYSQYVITDSGGLQKEAFWNKKRCFTLRNETEWIETVEQGANILVQENTNFDIVLENKPDYSNPYGSGDASDKIIKYIINFTKDKI